MQLKEIDSRHFIVENRKPFVDYAPQAKYKLGSNQHKKTRHGVLDGRHLVGFFIVFGTLVFGSSIYRAEHPDFISAYLGASKVEAQTIIVPRKDARADKLEKYLKSKNSPLAPYAAYIVDQADKNGISYTKVVGISHIESQFGTQMPDGSHNAWGLGGAHFMYFASWEESIKYESELLANSYKENENRGIQMKYCPDSDNCNPAWPKVVSETEKEIVNP